MSAWEGSKYQEQNERERPVQAKRVEPISPSQVDKTRALPPEVFEVFNHLIECNWDGRESRFEARTAAVFVAEKLNTTIEDVYARRLLDVEPAYRAKGWRVEFDKPGFNESYAATFLFAKPAPGSEGA